MSTTERVKSFSPGGEDLRQINRYTRREFTPEELYTFSLILCDNEIDRDGERFAIPALQKLAELFVGKTGIFDHDPSGKNQSARIYTAAVESDPGRKTSCQETYTYVKARAYMVRGEASAPLIAEIDGGIKKEVSVGCSVAKTTCSICGADSRAGCDHDKGTRYDGAVCHTILDEPTDAYEWSFVAVPAQRNAGVVKHYPAGKRERKEETPMQNTHSIRTMQELQKLFTQAETPITLQPAEAAALAAETERLRKGAELGGRYRAELAREVRSLAFRAGETVESAVLESVTEKMSIDELLAYRKAYEQRAAEPASPQLAPRGKTDAGNPANSVYRM